MGCCQQKNWELRYACGRDKRHRCRVGCTDAPQGWTWIRGALIPAGGSLNDPTLRTPSWHHGNGWVERVAWSCIWSIRSLRGGVSMVYWSSKWPNNGLLSFFFRILRESVAQGLCLSSASRTLIFSMDSQFLQPEFGTLGIRFFWLEPLWQKSWVSRCKSWENQDFP